MEARSFFLWVMLALLILFWITDLRGGVYSRANLIISETNQVFMDDSGELLNFSAEAKEAVEVRPFSYYVALNSGDRLGLILTLFFGILSPFVFRRDIQFGLIELINSKKTNSESYVLSKFLALFFIAFVFSLLSFIFVSAYSLYVSKTLSLSYQITDFILPVFISPLISSLYILSFTALVSIAISSSVGAIVILFVYWFFCVTQLHAISSPPNLNLILMWLIRFVDRMSPKVPIVLEENRNLLILNRCLYIILMIVFVILTSVLLKRRRDNGFYKNVITEE